MRIYILAIVTGVAVAAALLYQISPGHDLSAGR